MNGYPRTDYFPVHVMRGGVERLVDARVRWLDPNTIEWMNWSWPGEQIEHPFVSESEEDAVLAVWR